MQVVTNLPNIPFVPEAINIFKKLVQECGLENNVAIDNDKEIIKFTFVDEEEMEKMSKLAQIFMILLNQIPIRPIVENKEN